ncbi:MAG: hypothetical protein GX811_06235, partial [Lentisphaerae bacterium]|nr:hypothetical protein [Lentisphaerota bacterium]
DAHFPGLIPGVVNVHRKGTVTAKPLDVYYSVAGTAIPGLEYEELPGFVTIPVDETTATITIQPLLTSVMPPTKTVQLELISSAIRGSPSTIEMHIIAENLALWKKCMEIGFSGYNKEETLTNFPVLLVFEERVNRPGFNYSDFLSPPYDDLRFSSDDKITQLAFEVESWDPEGKSFVWVKILELTQDTKIYAFWGQEDVETPPCTTDGSVWNENYLAVWHMDDATDTTIKDSTKHGFNGRKKAENSPLEIDAVIGKGQEFDSTYIDLTGLTAGNTRIYTISMWVNGSDKGTNMKILDIQFGPINVAWGSMTAGQIGIYDGSRCNFGTTPELDKWHHIAFQCDLNEITMYLNSVQYGSSLAYDPKLMGGTSVFGAQYTKTQHYFPGMLDEFRISTTIRSPDWIWACYENQGSNDSFVDYGEVVSQILQGTIYIFW